MGASSESNETQDNSREIRNAWREAFSEVFEGLAIEDRRGVRTLSSELESEVEYKLSSYQQFSEDDAELIGQAYGEVLLNYDEPNKIFLHPLKIECIVENASEELENYSPKVMGQKAREGYISFAEDYENGDL